MPGWRFQIDTGVVWEKMRQAMVDVLHIVLLIRRVAQANDRYNLLHPLAFTLFGLTIMQVALGVSVIWTGRVPEVATAHQAMGAALLATVALLLMRAMVTKPDMQIASSTTASAQTLHSSAVQGATA